MKKLTAAVVLAALAWSAWWFFAAGQQKAAVERWFEDRRAAGWQASYADVTVRGFPNRIDTEIRDILLSDPSRGTGWEAPFLHIFQLSYKRGHVILAFPERQTLVLPSGLHDLEAQGLRMSVIEAGGTLVRANLEAEALNVSGARPMALAGPRVALEQQTDTPESYRLALTADAIASDRGALPGLPSALDGLRFDGTFRFDAPLTRDALAEVRPQPNRIELRLAEYKFDQLRVKFAGDLDVAGDGRLDGDLALQAENWEQVLDSLAEAGGIPEGMERAIEQGLGLLAGLSGGRNSLDMPLSFENGRMSLGPIPLGEGPRFRLP